MIEHLGYDMKMIEHLGEVSGTVMSVPPELTRDTAKEAGALCGVLATPREAPEG